MKTIIVAGLAIGILAQGAPSFGQAKADGNAAPIHDMSLCPAMTAVPHDHEHGDMSARGQAGMGFSQTATAHHFLLRADGGVIQLQAKYPQDEASPESIRHHLMHIAHAFASGDFDIPMFVHDETPPGAVEMKELKDKISYSFVETPEGGQVVIRTSDKRALEAVHKFLKYQIEQHHTGDPLSTPKNS
jgi:hypothetical protein